jgi:hypothetical protein
LTKDIIGFPMGCLQDGEGGTETARWATSAEARWASALNTSTATDAASPSGSPRLFVCTGVPRP